MKKLLYLAKKNAPVVMAGVSTLTAVGASVLSAVNTKTYIQKMRDRKPTTVREKVMIFVSSYWPTGLCLTVSAVSNFASVKASAKQIAVLTGLAVAAEEKISDILDEVEERYGKDDADLIKDEVLYPDPEEVPDMECDDSQYRFCLIDPSRSEDDEDRYIFFVSTIEHVIKVFSDFNISFRRWNWKTFADLKIALGIKPEERDEYVGWNTEDMMVNYGMDPWIIFDASEWREDGHGHQYRLIKLDVPPTVEALEWIR